MPGNETDSSPRCSTMKTLENRVASWKGGSLYRNECMCIRGGLNASADDTGNQMIQYHSVHIGFSVRKTATSEYIKQEEFNTRSQLHR